MADFEFSETILIGENDLYRFGVGRLADRWLGFAVGVVTDMPLLFVLPDVSEGVDLGLTDKDKAIRLTGAIVQDHESAYGDIDRWHVPPDLRGNPDDFRCANCNRVGCDGIECQEFAGFY